MNNIPAGVNTIIFDLGGVLVDLAPEKTALAFASLAHISSRDVFKVYASNPEFNAYEKGEIDDAAFRKFVRRIFSVEATDAQIDSCWNAMLVGLPDSKLKLLNNLKATYKTLLLSNTNAIHLSYIEDVMLQRSSLDKFFYKTYYSHKVGMRKPDTEIYEHLIAENKLVPEQTVFLDDNRENIEAAKAIGIQTIHVTHPNLIVDIFKTHV